MYNRLRHDVNARTRRWPWRGSIGTPRTRAWPPFQAALRERLAA